MIARAVVLFLAMAASVFADRVTLYYSVDSNVKGPQFEVSSRVWNSPRIVFDLIESHGSVTNKWDATGYTFYLKWSPTASDSSMYYITSSAASNGVAEFLVGTNDFSQSCEKWYCVLLAVSNTLKTTYAEGVMNLALSPEVTGNQRVSRVSVFDGSQYSYTRMSDRGPYRFATNYPISTNVDGSLTIGIPSH